MPCPTCRHPEREDELHSWSPPGVHDALGRPIPPACYTDEGDPIQPLEEEPVPTAEELAAVTPDPWLDPSHPAHVPPF